MDLPKYQHNSEFRKFTTIFFKHLSKARCIKFGRRVETFSDQDRELCQNFCLNNLVFQCLDTIAQQIVVNAQLSPNLKTIMDFRTYISKLIFLFDGVEKKDNFWRSEYESIENIRNLFQEKKDSFWRSEYESIENIRNLFQEI